MYCVAAVTFFSGQIVHEFCICSFETNWVLRKCFFFLRHLVPFVVSKLHMIVFLLKSLFLKAVIIDSVAYQNILCIL